MRPLTKLSSLEGELLRKLGIGREYVWDGGRLRLGYTEQPTCELVLECMLDEQPLRLGMLAEQWCGWLDLELPIPSWQMLAEDLHLPLAALTLEALQKALRALNLPYPFACKLHETPPTQAQKGWFLRLEQGDRFLSLQLLEVPLIWLESLINALHPIYAMDDGAPAFRAPVSLVAGWSTLERTRLHSMHIGDALVMRRACAVAEARLFLFLQRPLATVKLTFPDTIQIEGLMSDFNDWLDVQPAPPTNVSISTPDPLVTVVVEVASIELALNRLTSLEKGDILQGLIHQDELVTLKVGGRTFAHGILLDIDGQLAARIERLA